MQLRTIGGIIVGAILIVSNGLAASSATTNTSINNVLPVSPAEVKALRARNEALKKALQAAPINPAALGNTVRNINLTDSAPPPALHVVQGYTTNVSFIGENMKPWPIVNAVPGGNAVDVNQSAKNDPYNSSLTVNKPWVSTNVIYYLKGRVRPVTVYLYTAANTSKGLDATVTLKVNGTPPGTTALPVQNVNAVSDQLLNALDHAPGDHWHAIALDNTNIPVGIHYWVSPDHHHAIVRLSSGTLVMPEWGSQASSADKTMTAYEFNYVPLMLWVNSDNGKSFQIRANNATALIAGGQSVLKTKAVPSHIINVLKGEAREH